MSGKAVINAFLFKHNSTALNLVKKWSRENVFAVESLNMSCAPVLKLLKKQEESDVLTASALIYSNNNPTPKTSLRFQS